MNKTIKKTSTKKAPTKKKITTKSSTKIVKVIKKEEKVEDRKIGDTIEQNNNTKSKVTKEILYNQEQVKEMKKQTAILLLNKIDLLRSKYTEEQLSTQQILQYVASIYHIDIKYNKITEELREDDGNKM